MPAPITAATALPPFSISSKLAMITFASCGLGTSLTVTSVTTASMPSLPIKTENKSRPGLSGAKPPNSTTSPEIKTALILKILWIVKPYLRQCTPPEFSLTLPPIEHAICEEGSGA